jgi:two-component system cell cycle response regulator
MAKLLIAEDDHDAGALMKRVLMKGGHDVRLVDSGEAVLDACAENAPDVVLLDVSMPGMDGYEVARALKSRPPTADIPIVFVTGSCETRQKVQGFSLGANDYITKPFHRDELLARVEVAIRIKQQSDALKAANAQLTALSVTDGLTGLYNRRHLDQRLAEEIALAKRHSFPISCLMVDVDRFKHINDCFGHQEGDRVLQAVARVLRQSTRVSDIVGRYGGEEFMVITPGTPLASACKLGERIRTQMEAQEIPIADEVIHVTVSIGVAELGRTGTPESLIAAADRALYVAKRGGRNRVATEPLEA